MKRAKKAKPLRAPKETREIIARAKRLRELLGEFGATLAGFDPGVTAVIPGLRALSIGSDGAWWACEHLSFSGLEWAWLEPLLEELRSYRDGNERV